MASTGRAWQGGGGDFEISKEDEGNEATSKEGRSSRRTPSASRGEGSAVQHRHFQPAMRKSPRKPAVHPAVDDTIRCFTMKDKKEKKDMVEMDLHWKCLCGMTVVEFVRQKEGPSYMRVFLGPKQTELKKMTCARSGSQIQECLTDSHSGECKA